MTSSSWRWDRAHDGSPHQLEYRDQRLVGQVAYYDVIAGGSPGCVGYVRGTRVTGRCTSPALASKLVEARFATARS